MKPSILLLTLVLLSPSLHAKSMGVAGAIFPIGEIDMLLWIEQRLQRFEANGQMDIMKNDMKQAVKKQVERPTQVLGLGTTTEPATFYINPTLRLGKDVMDAQGRLLFAKGMEINPFDSTTWPNGEYPAFEFSKTLIFIDGDDEKQLAWAKQYRTNKPIKWILTNGSINKSALALNSRVYFDQKGTLTRALKLKNTPSVVMQVGTQWQIQEVDVSHQPR